MPLLDVAIIAGLILLGLLGIGFTIARLYHRASKEQAFVRTGMGASGVEDMEAT